MSEKNPNLNDVWRLLSGMNRRFGERFDALERRFDAMERQFVQLDSRVGASMGALKASIEARDFRLDEQGRRITELERSRT